MNIETELLSIKFFIHVLELDKKDIIYLIQ